MNDLIVMALQCDMTRVVSYMLDNSRSELVYGHVPKYDYTNDKPVTRYGPATTTPRSTLGSATTTLLRSPTGS